MWHLVGRWEWLVIELIVLGLAVAELLSLYRHKRRSEKARREAPPGDPSA